MNITMNVYYTGVGDSARRFVEELISTGVVEKIRNEEGNIKYDYFYPIDDPETVLLIDKWKNQEALDIHHGTEMMEKIIELREKYHIQMRIEKYIESVN